MSQIGLKDEPAFASRSETFKFVAGDTITLPCNVNNVGKYRVTYINNFHPKYFSYSTDFI